MFAEVYNYAEIKNTCGFAKFLFAHVAMRELKIKSNLHSAIKSKNYHRGAAAGHMISKQLDEKLH